MSELRNIRHTIHHVMIAQMNYHNPSPGYLWRCGVVGMLVTFGGDDVRDEPLEAGAGEAFRATVNLRGRTWPITRNILSETTKTWDLYVKISVSSICAIKSTQNRCCCSEYVCAPKPCKSKLWRPHPIRLTRLHRKR